MGVPAQKLNLLIIGGGFAFSGLSLVVSWHGPKEA